MTFGIWQVISRLVGASVAVVVLLAFANGDAAQARTLKSGVSEVAQIPSLRPEYPVPKEPNMLFYIQRSVNSNTVIYAARLDAQGHLDSKPVDAYWRWYNVDGHRKPLNFVERNFAYGVSMDRRAKSTPNRVAFKVVALPEMTLFLERDDQGTPRALIQMGSHLASLVYAFLQVDDHGFTPDVTSIDLFGIDTVTGKALQEHVARD
jgi:hypothetical protein